MTSESYFDMPVFVLGLPRSGTSLVAGCLSVCGAWTGTTIGPSPANPKGFFEHAAIREQVVKAILGKLGCDPLGVTKLPPKSLEQNVPDLRDTLRAIIEADGYTHESPWMYKDAKLTLLWPMFARAFPNARWVVVKRDSKSFVDSCLRTPFMVQHSQDRKFWKVFAGEYNSRLKLLKKSGATQFEISTPDLLSGRLYKLESAIKKLGLPYRENEIRSFIAPEHWHGAS